MFQSEGQGEEWHGHVTTLTVSSQFRRLGIAHTLMDQLEKISEVCLLETWYIRGQGLGGRVSTSGHGRGSTSGHGRGSTSGHGRVSTSGHGRGSTSGHGRGSTSGHGRGSTRGPEMEIMRIAHMRIVK